LNFDGLKEVLAESTDDGTSFLNLRLRIMKLKTLKVTLIDGFDVIDVRAVLMVRFAVRNDGIAKLIGFDLDGLGDTLDNFSVSSGISKAPFGYWLLFLSRDRLRNLLRLLNLLFELSDEFSSFSLSFNVLVFADRALVTDASDAVSFTTVADEAVVNDFRFVVMNLSCSLSLDEQLHALLKRSASKFSDFTHDLFKRVNGIFNLGFSLLARLLIGGDFFRDDLVAALTMLVLPLLAFTAAVSVLNRFLLETATISLALWKFLAE